MSYSIRFFNQDAAWMCLVREEVVRCGAGRPVLASGTGPTRRAAAAAARESVIDGAIIAALERAIALEDGQDQAPSAKPAASV